MEVKSGQDLYVLGLARRERHEPDLVLSPEEAVAVLAAREQATEGYAIEYGDSIGRALEGVRDSGRTASFLEFYQGPLSKSVLAALLENGISELNPI